MRLSTFDSDAISEYFDKHVMELARAALWNRVRAKGLGGVPERLLHWVSRRERARLAAERWLRPNPLLALNDLARLQEDCGFSGVHFVAFCGSLYRDCSDFAEAHEPLRLWILKRVSLLEAVFTPIPPMSPQLADVATALRRELGFVGSAFVATPHIAAQSASHMCSMALSAVAHVVADVFRCGSPCRVSANLMLEGRRWHTPHSHPEHAVIERNQHRAATLWGDFDDEQNRLMVVAETTEAAHVGFWVPSAAAADDCAIPGATLAHRDLIGSSVFRDDLPVVPCMNQQLFDEWSRYMSTTFQDDLFISLPIRVPSAELGRRTVLGIVNINVSFTDERGWRRAYHQEWLERVLDRVGPIIEIAYWGYTFLGICQPGTVFHRESDIETSWSASSFIDRIEG